MMQLLLDQGPAMGCDGEFPLHNAVKSIDNMKDRVQVLWLLLHRRADRIKESKLSGCLASHVVGSKRFARDLIEYGDVQSDCRAKSVLMVIKNLLSNPNIFGQTPVKKFNRRVDPRFKGSRREQQKKEIVIYLERASRASSMRLTVPGDSMHSGVMQNPDLNQFVGLGNLSDGLPFGICLH
jgi:hypothetical protein